MTQLIASRSNLCARREREALAECDAPLTLVLTLCSRSLTQSQYDFISLSVFILVNVHASLSSLRSVTQFALGPVNIYYTFSIGLVCSASG